MPRRRCYNPTTTSLFAPSIVQKLPASILANLPALHISPRLLSIGPPLVASSSFYDKYQQYILDIVQYITDRVSLDTVLKDLLAIQPEIQSKAAAARVIANIEDILLGVVDNLTHKVSLHIILNRLQYVTNLLETVDPSELPIVYGQVAELLAYVIDQITNREGLALVLENLTAIRTQMTLEVHLAKEILQAQEILIGVVENVMNRVNLSIVLNRLLYVQALLASIREGI
jgi:hypothetical protein